MSAQKGFAPTLVIFAAVIILVAGYFIYNHSSKNPVKVTNQQATQSATPSNEMAAWKTYTNSLVGFSVKYPANFKVNSSDSYLILDEGTMFKPTNGCQERVTFRVELSIEKTSITSLNQIVPWKNSTSQSKINIDSIPALRYKWAVNNCEYGENVVTLFKGYSINIANFASDSRTESEFNQILSTFKFTN